MFKKFWIAPLLLWGVLATASEKLWNDRQEEVISALLTSFDKFKIKSERDKFEKNQKAWIEFSKRNCEELYEGSKEGSEIRLFLTQCHERTVRRRLEDLRTVYFQTWPKSVNDKIDQWISPEPQAAENEWLIYRFNGELCRSPPGGWEIKGDFDGNGKPDRVRLEDNALKRKRRLAVWMNGDASPVILEENEVRYASNYLSLKPPGVFEPFIDSKDKTPVKTEFESFATGTCESSEVIYYWDKKTKKFLKVWTGD